MPLFGHLQLMDEILQVVGEFISTVDEITKMGKKSEEKLKITHKLFFKKRI